MKNFEHVDATSVAGAVNLLRSNANCVPIAGGTDLLTQVKLGLVKPDLLVNLKTIPNLEHISFDKTGLNIGALATLDTIANNKEVREHYPALIKAIEVTASPQIRNSGTIGGNLTQSSRCWYYRGQFNCWLKQGEVCYAQEGENSHHAIFGGGPCYMVHPSDLAPVLIALETEVITGGRGGERRTLLAELFQLPSQDSRQLTVLEPGEIIIRLHVPMPLPASRGTYLKAMERKVWAFGLASVALQVVVENSEFIDARVVLGAVAPKPWRLFEVESFLRNQKTSPAVIARAAELVSEGAEPLGHNRYKIALVKGIFLEAFSNIL